VVGLDVYSHVVNTMRDKLTMNAWHGYFALPVWFNKLIEEVPLGQKTKRGVYKKVGKEIHVLDVATHTYRLSRQGG